MNQENVEALDWEHLNGHYDAKRRLEVAASGNHSILLVGPPNAGKTRLSRSLVTILPDKPFIAPHPQTDSLSDAIENAHGGILFLNHLEQWDSLSRTLLRETVAQQPGQFLLVATTAYCPCGNFADEREECNCSLVSVEAYQKRLYQTIDACFAIEVRIPSVNHIAPRRSDEPSHAVRKRVDAARLVQDQRNGVGRLNSVLSLLEVEGSLDTLAQKLLVVAKRKLHLIPEQELFLLQTARTSADLASAYSTVSGIESNHLAEAICYRHRWKAATPTQNEGVLP
jgi:magnesium chelatase family protein